MLSEINILRGMGQGAHASNRSLGSFYFKMWVGLDKKDWHGLHEPSYCYYMTYIWVPGVVVLFLRQSISGSTSLTNHRYVS